MKGTKVGHRKLRVEVIGDAMKKSWCGSRGYNIVDVEEQVGDRVSIIVDKERRVRGGGCEAEATNVRGEAMIPGAGCLFAAVERLLEEAYVVRRGGVHKAD